jgi:hypothetical protein
LTPLLAFALLLAPTTARATGDYPPGPLKDWFEGQWSTGIPGAEWPDPEKVDPLHHPVKQWCCDMEDGHVLEDGDWRRGVWRYEVRIGDRWYPVPDGAEVDPKGGPNPTGHAVVWYNKTVPEMGEYWIYCFTPGDLY